MKYILLFLCSFYQVALLAQGPLIKGWDKRLGGKSDDVINCFQQTRDNGYILGGYSYSGISGDKTQPIWGNGSYCDYWVVKLNSSGIKEWDKRFGGVETDVLTSLQQTLDGGYILGGWSWSSPSGDKTDYNWGYNDYWIIKIDSIGNKVWDKDFGGDYAEYLTSIDLTNDGGYVLGGYSSSNISGNKTQPKFGGYDYWIVKIDSAGNKLWDMDFGGTGDDILHSLQQTIDMGFIIGGSSISPIGGNKWVSCWNSEDFWIIKTDSAGNINWQQDFGGTNGDQLFSLIQTSDSGYIFGGLTESDVNGNKTQPRWGFKDFWIIKTDSLGIIEWDKDFGGSAEEQAFGSIIESYDKGFLLSGTSYSGISGDKTENNLGVSQAWLVKTDSVGSKEWDKTIFTTPDSKGSAFALQSSGGCYVISKPTYSGIGGHKTQDNWDTTYITNDFWISKFCDSLSLPFPVSNFVANYNQFCEGTCIDFINLSQYALFCNWDFPGSSQLTSNDFSPTGICYNTPGLYDVILIVGNDNGTDTLVLDNYISVYTIPQSSFSSTQQNACAGTCIDFNNLSLNANSYQWNFYGAIVDTSSNENPSNVCYNISGQYDVLLVATNGVCTDSSLQNNYITVYPPAQQQFIQQLGDTLISDTGFFTYQWFFNGDSISGATNYFYIAQVNGNYNIVCTDTNGCEVEAAAFNVLTGLHVGIETNLFNITPNPFYGNLVLNLFKSTNEIIYISILNVTGEVLFENENTLKDQELNLSFLPSGLFFLKIRSDKFIYTTRIIKL